ncbi:MAG TPA: hypothetical protein VGX92_21270 [Pyrinomonadaceae bacterium]|jgi:hypothetical protein|nr:hypothetical protein [Pyrinomonadaceae bacterium]
MPDNSLQDNRLNAKSVLIAFVALLLLGGLAGLTIFLLVKLLGLFTGINPALVAAATTVIVTAFTVMGGRYFERRKEIEAAYRDKKTAIYDDFLLMLFRMLLETKEDADNSTQDANPETVKFLREHHRKLILWSGPKGLKSYSEWYKLLQTNPTSAQAILKMEGFFRALRADLGQSNRGLKDGDILRLILNDTDLLLQISKTNPDVTLQELAALKEQLTKKTN